jgi:hypothetical protein
VSVVVRSQTDRVFVTTGEHKSPEGQEGTLH